MTPLLLQPLAWLLCLIGLAWIPAQAAEPPVYTSLFSKAAVSGFDPVAYFTEGRPVKGDVRFVTRYKGAEWRFASADNRERFLANPERYAPQYGGYCAWAVAQGYTASGDPQRWKIVNDRLYLNYNLDVQKKWEASIPEFIQAADRHWPRLLARP